jgi:hypothetical protein
MVINLIVMNDCSTTSQYQINGEWLVSILFYLFCSDLYPSSCIKKNTPSNGGWIFEFNFDNKIFVSRFGFFTNNISDLTKLSGFLNLHIYLEKIIHFMTFYKILICVISNPKTRDDDIFGTHLILYNSVEISMRKLASQLNYWHAH